jgi:RNA polymerase sigma-70 factor (ECF subfamily)
MNDVELRTAILLNKEEGFKNLVTHFQDMIYNVAFSYVHNDFTAEDITQDVFIKIYCKFETFHGLSSLSTWIYRITINACHDYARREKTTRIISLDQVVNHSFTLGQSFETQETKEEVRYAISQLPEKYRGIVILRYLEKLSCKEISSILQCSISSVEINLFRARKLLKKSLEPLIL